MSSDAIAESLHALQLALRSASGARLAIPLYGYPDPDSMGAAWALAELAAREGVQADILHIDPVSHTENRLLLREVGIPLIPWVGDGEGGPRYDGFALVDAHALDPRYASLATVPCWCVWDHHVGTPSVEARISNIDTAVGSTCTLAVQYLAAAGLLSPTTELLVRGSPPPGSGTSISRLATALLVGIATDTDDFLLARPADYLASARAAELADLLRFRRIHRRAYSPAAMKVFHRALDSLVARPPFGIAWVGNLPPILRDAIPQAADLLVSRLDLDTVVVFGHVGAAVNGSVRTLDPGVDPGALVARALKLGAERSSLSGGGRAGKGGFRWDLGESPPPDIEQVRKQIEDGFLDSMASG